MNSLRRLRTPRVLLTVLLALASGAWAVRAAPAPQPAAAQQVFLPLVAKAGSAPSPAPSPTPTQPAPQPTPPPATGPTSDELIAAAVQAGTLDRETALRYRLLAAFNDARLPASYRGAVDARPSSAYGDALRAFARLAPETQALVREYSVPPSAENSWEAQQPLAPVDAPAPMAAAAWATTCQTSANIKVWYHPENDGDAEQARRVCELVDGTIWPRLIDLMGRKPLPDDTAPHTGGDARLDIYLVAARSSVMSARGSASTVPVEQLCRATPTYMLVNRAGHTRSQLAELLMRAILSGYDADLCGEYAWLSTATSRWAAEYVYRADNEEHVHAPGYLRAAANPLESASSGELEIPLPGEPLFMDGAMLWPYYLRNIQSRPDLIAATWARSGEPNSLEVFNSVVPGGWAEQWPIFARMAWNRDSVNDYAKFDDLPHGLVPLRDEPITLDGASAASIALDGAVKHLALHSFRFTFPDPSVRSFAVVNRYGEADLRTARVQALLKIDGQWRVEDWTATPLHAFCRDMRAERLEELVLIVSNHEFANRSHALRGEDGPLLSYTNLACRGWQAEVEVSVARRGNMRSQDETVTAQATFERRRPAEGGWVQEDYRAVEGTASWSHTGRIGCAAGTGNGSYSVRDTGAADAQSSVMVEQYGLSYVGERFVFTGDRRYMAYGGTAAATEARVNYFYTDPRCGSGVMPETLLHFMWLNSGYEPYSMVASNDGATLKGTYAQTEDEIHWEYRWTLTALPPE